MLLIARLARSLLIFTSTSPRTIALQDRPHQHINCYPICILMVLSSAPLTSPTSASPQSTFRIVLGKKVNSRVGAVGSKAGQKPTHFPLHLSSHHCQPPAHLQDRPHQHINCYPICILMVLSSAPLTSPTSASPQSTFRIVLGKKVNSRVGAVGSKAGQEPTHHLLLLSPDHYEPPAHLGDQPCQELPLCSRSYLYYLYTLSIDKG